MFYNYTQKKETSKNHKKRVLRTETLEIRQMLSAANLLHFAPEAREAITVAYENSISNVDMTTNELQAALLPTSASTMASLQGSTIDFGNCVQSILGTKYYYSCLGGNIDKIQFTSSSNAQITLQTNSKYTVSYTYNSSSKLLIFEFNNMTYKVQLPSIGNNAGTANYSVYRYSVLAWSGNCAYSMSGNTSSNTGNTTYSNLQASNGSLSSTTVTKGTIVKFTTGTIKNIGNYTSTAGKVKFYASENSTISTSDIYLGTVSLAALAQNKSTTITCNLNTSSLNAGTYYIGWIVESGNDSDTSNNMARCSTPLTIKAAAPKSNLQASNGSLSSTTVTKGTIVKFTTGTIKNIGNYTSTAGKVKFYASENSTISTSDIYLGTVSLAALAQNKSTTITCNLNTSSLNAGTYYIGWIVESGNDSDTSNNMARCSTPLTIKAASSGSTSLQKVDTPSIHTRLGDGTFQNYSIYITVTPTTPSSKYRYEIQYCTMNLHGYQESAWKTVYSENGNYTIPSSEVKANAVKYGDQFCYKFKVRIYGNSYYSDFAISDRWINFDYGDSYNPDDMTMPNPVP